MSICTDLYRPTVIRPRRVRAAECSAFEGISKWVNFFYSLNLTPDPADNKLSSGLGAWSIGDLPVTYAMQDVSTRGDDLLFVAISNRVYLLDWERYRDEWNWETYGKIYRKLTLGPIPGSRDEQEGGTYTLTGLKRFRKLSYHLARPPADDPVQSEYKVSVADDGDTAGTSASGYRRTQRAGTADVAKRGYSFLVTLEHDANEDFPLLDWTAEWEELGGRRRADTVVAT
jgi:hypothetical protein